MSGHMRIFTVAWLLLAATMAQGAPITNDNWVGMGSCGGINDVVRSVVSDASGNIYAGGDFTSVGGVACNHIAKWDGSSWSSLGDGIDGSIYSLACDSSGNLYAGGSFATAGQAYANGVAKWDGSKWSRLSEGTEGTVYALACDSSGNLYAGGSFESIGYALANGIAKWDGSEWSVLGDGIDGTVYSLACDSSNKLYAGGAFEAAGYALASNIALWDGSKWAPVGDGTDGEVDALALDAASNLYVGGKFQTAGWAEVYGIAKWNGSSWSPLGDGLDSTKTLVFDSSANLYAGGEFGVGKWDGEGWSSLGDGIDGAAYAIACASPTALFVGGEFSSAGDTPSDNIAQWDGATWKCPSGNGTNAEVYALSYDASGNLYAGGWFTAAGGLGCDGIAKWNGSKWSPLGSGLGGWVYALAFNASGVIYAGGDFGTGNIAKGSGSSWSSLGSGMDDVVNALAVNSSGSLYAGGNFRTAGGVTCNGVAMWNGSAWSALGAGVEGDVNALALDSAGVLYAGGDFTAAGGVACSRVAKWDGTTWSSLGTGVGGTVYGLVAGRNGNLYAGGTFGVAKWNGKSWTALGGGTDGVVNTLAFDGEDNLVIGGWFTTAGGVTCNGIAKWDGEAWWPLGGGVGTYYPEVSALACDPSGNLFVGGYFSTAGGKVSMNIANCLLSGAPRTVTFVPESNGSISGMLVQTVSDGKACEPVNAVPDVNYTFTGWTGDYVGTENPLTVTNVTANMTITANFALKTYGIAVSVDAAADSGMVDPGGKAATIMVGQGANQTFTINPYSGCRIADVLVDGVSVGSVTSYTFTAVSAAHTLKASFAAIAAEEFVITATAGFGGTVTPSGETVVVSGASVPVAITPDSGYAIKNVWVDGVSIGAVYSYKFTSVSADHSLSASFSVSDGGQALRAVNGNSITLQVTPPPSGATAWGCEELLPEGLTPDNITGPNGSWNASKRKITWNGEGNASERLSYTVNGDAGTYVLSGGANFGDATVTTVGDSGVILSSLHPADQGGDWAIVMQEAISYVSGWQAGTNPMSYAARALYIWKNGEDYHFDGSLDRPDCWALGVANKAALKRVAAGTSERSVNATTNVVTIKVTPPAGALVWTCEEFLPEGLAAGNITGANRNYNDATGKISWYDFVVDTTPVELTYKVSGAPGSYSLDDGSAAFDGTVAQTSPAVTVVIAKQRFVITPTAGLGGRISPDTAVTLDSGSAQEFAMIPDTGHHIADVLVDGSPIGPVASYKFANVTKNYTITASFALDTFTLAYAAGTGGTLSGVASQTVEYGASGTAVEAVANTGHHFVSWSDGSTANPRTDTNVKANLSVTATFALKVYTVTFAATAGGSVAGQTTQSVEYGGSCSAVEAVAARGYSFTAWDNGLGATNPLTIANVTSDLTITATFAKKAKPEYWVAYGSLFVINASDLEDSATFAKAPKVVAYKDGKAGGKAKVLGFKKGSDSVNCVWQGKEKPGTYSLLVNGETLTEEFVVENPNDFAVTLTPDTGVANDKITVTGSYFGSTCPKVTMEWQVESKGKTKTKKATCKVVKPYKYDDANGKPGKSVMYVGQEASESGFQPGDSELTFVVPKGITESTPATLKLNCNGAIVERQLNPTK